MSSISIDELRAFVAVFESGGFTSASRRLALTTNAVSLRVQKLEEALSIQLFVRTTRSVSPTNEARAFYERVSRVLDDLDSAQDELRANNANVQRTVRIAMPAEVATVPFFERLRELLKDHPNLSVQTRITDTPTNALTDGFDVALVLGRSTDSGFVSKHLGQIKWVLAASAPYIDRHGRPNVPADLARHACLPFLFSQQQYEWALVDRSELETTVQVRGTYHADDSRTLRDATYCGLGIGAVPERECERAERDGRLQRVLPNFHFRPLDIHALVVERRVGMPPVIACLRMLRSAALEL